MAEYLAPGIYVEETSFRPKTIEGVSTSTAAFVGPTRFGPIEGEPELLTSFADFERIYGGLDPLMFTDGGSLPADVPTTNFLAHGVRAFFEEGGRRCYVARAYTAVGEGRSTRADAGSNGLTFTARYPGRAGDMRVRITPRMSQDILISNPLGAGVLLRGANVGDVVAIREDPATTNTLYEVVRVGNETRLRDAAGTTRPYGDFTPGTDRAFLVTAEVAIERPIVRPRRPQDDPYGPAETIGDLKFDPANPMSLASMFAAAPDSRRLALTIPLVMVHNEAGPTAVDWAEAAFAAGPAARTVLLENGSDGQLPTADAYRGPGNAATATTKSGLFAIEELEDVSIVAAPGYSHGYTTANPLRPLTIQQHLINHCTTMRYRIAVLDSPDDDTLGEVRNYRARIDSKYAALYYPWVTILDPITQRELNLPPSGFVAGIYARNDVEHGVQKAPANEVVRLAVRFERTINKAQQDVLNPEGINCFRFFEGRGNRLWGARTATSDGEWKYVNLRRYFAYLERSIDVGTQVFVFDSNGERLWDNIRRTISAFLFSEWKAGRLMGTAPEEAFFVRCDRSTMSQNDIDNGRLICEIGVAPLRPAEFVIFRIGQMLLEGVA